MFLNIVLLSHKHELFILKTVFVATSASSIEDWKSSDLLSGASEVNVLWIGEEMLCTPIGKRCYVDHSTWGTVRQSKTLPKRYWKIAKGFKKYRRKTRSPYRHRKIAPDYYQEIVNLTAIRNHFTFTKSVKTTSSIDPRARKDRERVVFLYCSNCCGIDLTLSIKTNVPPNNMRVLIRDL